MQHPLNGLFNGISSFFGVFCQLAAKKQSIKAKIVERPVGLATEQKGNFEKKRKTTTNRKQTRRFTGISYSQKHVHKPKHSKQLFKKKAYDHCVVEDNHVMISLAKTRPLYFLKLSLSVCIFSYKYLCTYTVHSLWCNILYCT